MSADRAAFRALTELLLGDLAVDLDLVDWVDLPVRLFSIAAATPVSLYGGLEARDVVVRRPVPAPVAVETAVGRRRLLAAVLTRLPDRWRGRVDAVLASLATVRRRTWILAAVAAAALIVTVLMLPTADASDGSAATSPEVTPTPEATGPAVDPALTSDDPLDALVVLLERRERCLAERSILCLDAVAQPGSSALADDQALIRALQQGAETSEPLIVSVADLVIEERLGDSALVGIIDPGDSEPASILLMKGEAGWLIRSYLR